MRHHLKQIAFAGLLACLGTSAMATNYFFVQPKAPEMSKLSPLSVALNTYALPQGTVGVSYNAGAGFDLKTLLTVSGDQAYNPALVGWTVMAGTLPAGLSILNGVLTGIPLASGEQNFTLRASYKSSTGEQSYQVIVGAITVSLASGALPAGSIAQAYDFDLKNRLAVSGDGAYLPGSGVTWSIASGALPVGLSLGPDGRITGTPTTVSTPTFLVQALYKTKVGQQSYSIDIANGIALQSGGYRTWADGSLATSCNAYLKGDSTHTYAGATGDGVYRVQPPSLPAIDVNCDMTTDGGGWALVLSVKGLDNPTEGSITGSSAPSWLAGTGAVNSVSPTITGYAKLSDSYINAMRVEAYRLVNETPYYQTTNAKRFVKPSCVYAHSTTSADVSCRTTYASLAWTNPLVGDTSASNKGIGDRHTAGTFFFELNGAGMTYVGNNITSRFRQWGSVFMWVR